MSALGMGGMLNEGTSSEWYTPPHIFDALGLRFDLDPCAPAGGVPWIPADDYYSIENDGLMSPWYGRVWMNPPYGRAVSDWTRRLYEHGNGIGLVFARVDAQWAQRAIRRADAVCLIEGRLSFVSRDRDDQIGHNAAAPSMLLGYGRECASAVLGSGLGITFIPATSPVSRVASPGGGKA